MLNMINQTDSWVNDDGNFCFNWKVDDPKYFLTSLIGIIIIPIISVIIDYFLGTNFSSFTIFGCIFIALPLLYFG